jgi:DNA-directed RNA polymerase subunit M/transcription elongation factor TFIIS
MTLYGLLLQTKGEVKKVKLADSKTANLTHDDIQKALKKKTEAEYLGNYTYEDYTLTFFGYKKGKTGTENKHDLSQILDDTYYGDILIIASSKQNTWEIPVTYDPVKYEKFYTSVFNKSDTDDESDSSSEMTEEDKDVKEEDEDDAEVVEEEISKKKKVAVEDGVPEDEVEEEEEEVEEDDAGDDAEEDGIDDENHEFVMDSEDEVVEKKVSKKKSGKANLTVTQNTGRAQQQKLFLTNTYTELKTVDDIPANASLESKHRRYVLEICKKRFSTIFTEQQNVMLEKAILSSAVTDADKKCVLKCFENNLFVICYMNAMRRIISNLDPTSYVKNTQLLEKIKNNDISIELLSEMSSVDYAPYLYTDMRERQSLREQQQLEGNKAMATDMFKCNRCKKRETTFYELQTRSADEPMTKFITCVNCGNHWRQ